MESDLAAIEKAGVIRLITRYNSSSYFIHRGGQAGFDYELVWRFARERGMTVEVVVPEPGEDLITLLNSGRGDLIGAGIVPDAGLERWVTWTRPTNFVRKVVVLPAGFQTVGRLPQPGRAEHHPAGRRSLPRPDSRTSERTLNIQFFVTSGRPGDQAEDLLAQLSRGELDAVAVNDNIARSALAYLPDLKLGAHLGRAPAHRLAGPGQQPRTEGRPEPVPQGTSHRQRAPAGPAAARCTAPSTTAISRIP